MYFIKDYDKISYIYLPDKEKQFMKKLAILIAAFVMVFSVQETFAHHHTRNLQTEYHHYDFEYMPGDKGGYTGASDTEITSVLQAKKLGSSVYVKLKGKIVSKLGKETYMFKDNTGTVKIEIDDDNWNGVKAGPKDTVIIEGELEREQGGVIVDVDKIELAD